MNTKMIVGLLIGAAIGGVIGYFGKCSTATCPFTSTWWGAAILGAVIGAFISNFVTGVQTTPEGLTNVIDIESSTQFEEIVSGAGEKDVLVDFYMNMCPPCKKIMPVIYSFAKDNSENLIVLKVNAPKIKELSVKFNVSGVPALLHLKNGKEVSRKVGYQSAEELKNWILGGK